MPYINVKVDLDEVYDQMGKYDKRDIAEWLYEDGILDTHPNPEIRKIIRGNEESQGEKELRDVLDKLWNAYHRLSNEDELLIKQIANKL
jgi:hypothetical protein